MYLTAEAGLDCEIVLHHHLFILFDTVKLQHHFSHEILRDMIKVSTLA